MNTILTILCLGVGKIVVPPALKRRNASQKVAGFQPKVVLVTGVGMAKGLALARLFFEAGHTVIGADFRTNGVAGSGCISKALARFYSLDLPSTSTGPQPYLESILSIVLREKVDLWVSCSGVASAIEDGHAKEFIEARTQCKAIQFDAATTGMLHEKHTFMEHVQNLGLDVPETHVVTAEAEVLSALEKAPVGRKYIMKPIGMDDANRGNMSLLPKATAEETSKQVSTLQISSEAPWILQQFVNGSEYCTHSLVVHGQVRAFVACPSAELLMHYQQLPFDSKLSIALLEFTRTLAADKGVDFTGHMCFDFIVDQGNDGELLIFPIECNPRAHTAVVLFRGTPRLIEAYLSALSKDGNQSNMDTVEKAVIMPERRTKYYWIGHDLTDLLQCLLRVFRAQASARMLSKKAISFADHLIHWKDGTFAVWDPAPWWWLYHCYWPMQFWGSLRTGKRWSRVNVSTNKVFAC